MAYFGITNKLLADKTIQIYNYGNCLRDYRLGELFGWIDGGEEEWVGKVGLSAHLSMGCEVIGLEG